MWIFLAEKGITIPTEQVDLGSLQQRPAASTAISPLQRVVRDDGAVLTESVAVCRYFEALHLDPPLFGRDARESALIEMWNRRVLYIRVSTVFQHFAFGHEGDGRSAGTGLGRSQPAAHF